jgi:hypothetical protein
MSILSASAVRIEDISDLVGHSGTSLTESIYRQEIRPMLTTGNTAMNKILSKKRPDPLSPTPSANPDGSPPGSRRSERVPDQGPEPLLTC